MKNILLVVLVALVALSCGDRNGYVIEGDYRYAPDGTKIYLTAYDDILSVVDSTTVQGGKFVFEGISDSISVCFLSSSNVIDGGYVVLEPGCISFSFSKGGIAGGTPLNHAVSRFMKEKERLADLGVFSSQGVIGRLNVEEHMADSVRALAGIANAVFGAYSIKNIKDNLDNPLGCFFFVHSVGVVAPGELSQVAELIPVKYRGRLYAPKKRQLEQEISALSYASYAEAGALETAVGKKYQNFELKNLDGANVLMSDRVSKNKYTLLFFWASWNSESLESLDVLKKVYSGYSDKGFDIVAVSLDSSVGRCRSAVDAYRLPWLQLCNPGGGSSELAAAYGVTSLPYWVLINKEGTIILRTASVADVEKKLSEVF
jgi:peroxiredoxin